MLRAFARPWMSSVGARPPGGACSQTVIAGWISSVAHWAYNPTIATSNLASATAVPPGVFVLWGAGSGDGTTSAPSPRLH